MIREFVQIAACSETTFDDRTEPVLFGLTVEGWVYRLVDDRFKGGTQRWERLVALEDEKR